MRELLAAGKRTVHEVLVAADREPSAVLEEIADLARAAGVPVVPVSPGRLASEAVTDSAQGVIARARPVEAAELDDLVATALPFLVVLDGVTDPRNLGSILRTALSAGVTGVVLPAHRSARLSPAATKAAAGAIEHLPIAVAAGVPAALVELARGHLWTVGLDAEGDVDVEALTVASEPLALVLGAEGRGLASLTRRRCDVLARIELYGPLESLNVAAAAAIACFAVARRRAQR